MSASSCRVIFLRIFPRCVSCLWQNMGNFLFRLVSRLILCDSNAMTVGGNDAVSLELIHRDCLEGMAQMPAASVDLVVTSPPYNLGIQYGKYEDSKTTEDYLKWAAAWGRELHRVLK